MKKTKNRIFRFRLAKWPGWPFCKFLMKGLFAWVGFPTTCVYFERCARVAGSTKWNYWRLWNFALEGITSFSTVPLKIASYLGFLAASFGFLYATFLVVRTLLFGDPVKGYPSLMTAVLFFGGVQLLFIGVIGEYIARIHDEVKGRPIYVVESLRGIQPPDVQMGWGAILSSSSTGIRME